MKRVQNPQVCHGHSRPIVELAYRWVSQNLRQSMVNMKTGMLSCCSSMADLYHLTSSFKYVDILSNFVVRQAGLLTRGIRCS